MTNKEKQLLLIDLCARLPYGVYVHIRYNTGEPCYGKLISQDIQWFIDSKIEIVKPYLHPMSSVSKMWGGLTKEEIENPWILFDSPVDALDYFLINHIDFRGLIPMGLALEAKEGMYKNE